MSETSIIAATLQTLKTKRFSMTNEKKAQMQMYEILKPLDYVREHRLDDKNIPDFFHLQHGIGIEVKIKGSKKNIYRQLERYCTFETVKALILVTGRQLGLPPEIGGKPCYYVNLSKAYL